MRSSTQIEKRQTKKPRANRTGSKPTRSKHRGSTLTDGVISPELARFFDAMANHFPGHVMQRVMRTDGTVRYTYVSPGLAALGLDRDAILAAESSPQDWVHPDDRARWRTALSTSAAMLETLDEEVRVIGGDGRVRWIRSIGNPRRLDNGDVVWDGIALDVTDKREALNAMRLAKADAERAEAQKARLLANLLAVLEGPTGLLEEATTKDLVRENAHQLLAYAASAMQRAMALLQGAEVPPDRGVEIPPDPRLAGLTKRQYDVLILVEQGLSNRQVADRLGLTEGTVKLHVASLLKALGVQNRTQAAAIAHQAGMSGGRPAP